MSTSPEQPGRQGSETVEDRGDRPVDDQRFALLLLFGRLQSGRRRVELPADPFLIGREVDANHLQLADERASRRHAEIHWSEVHRRHWIRDLGSRNGVYLNGIKVAREALQAGDLLRIGNTVFRVAVSVDDRPWLTPAGPVFVGESRSLRVTLDRAARVAASDAPVLIAGPTGTGKELLAEAIHRTSGRSGPLVAVNAAALPANLVESELFGHEKGAFSGADAPHAGVFRAARGGTLFLDEIGELAFDVQAVLLRALDTGAIRPVGAAGEVKVDVRVIAATNRDLAGEIAAGRFRPDLYARLAEYVVQVDPLRDRPEDLEPLWRHFVAELGRGATLEPSGAAFEAMALHAWPFNVRELRQLVRSALLAKPSGGEVSVDDLPPAMRSRPGTPGDAEPPERPLAPGEAPSRRQLQRLIEEFHGNVKDVAAFLGKDRKQVYRWLRRDNIDPNLYRDDMD